MRPKQGPARRYTALLKRRNIGMAQTGWSQPDASLTLICSRGTPELAATPTSGGGIHGIPLLSQHATCLIRSVYRPLRKLLSKRAVSEGCSVTELPGAVERIRQSLDGRQWRRPQTCLYPPLSRIPG